jgi:hypothetical protein
MRIIFHEINGTHDFMENDMQIFLSLLSLSELRFRSFP